MIPDGTGKHGRAGNHLGRRRRDDDPLALVPLRFRIRGEQPEAFRLFLEVRTREVIEAGCLGRDALAAVRVGEQTEAVVVIEASFFGIEDRQQWTPAVAIAAIDGKDRRARLNGKPRERLHQCEGVFAVEDHLFSHDLFPGLLWFPGGPCGRGRLRSVSNHGPA